MDKNIIEIYLDRWKDIWNYEKVCVGSIWFDILDFRDIISLLKKNNILIKSIELFSKDTLKFIPPDFWFDGENLDENYSKIDSFLKSLYNLDTMFFVLSFNEESIENEINIFLNKKYEAKVTDDEKLSRKKNWWEFIL